MSVYHLPYGHETLLLELPDHLAVDWIEPPFAESASDPLQIVRDALEHPVDGQPLSKYRGAQSVAIAVNDKTRPVPLEFLLPPLLDALHAIGIPAKAIQFLIATGTHLPMPADEFFRVLPADIIDRYIVLSHDCDDNDHLVFCGTTSRETPIWANRDFVEADLRIVVGDIEPHHFAGFSGGYKSAAIGLAGRQTINQNHIMLMDPNAHVAEYNHNPLRQDIEEIGDVMGVQFALNAILNGEKKIVRAISGHPRAVIQAGIPISQSICQTPCTIKYDLVIASAGGAPKDINFYQAQKALTHASLFTRDGGVIILVASCPEGSGSRGFEEFMEDVTSPAAALEKFRLQGFRVGPHKAFQVARDAMRVRIILLSQLPSQQVERFLMTPAGSMDEAIAQAMVFLPPTPVENIRIAVLPRATSTIPI